MKNKIIIFIIAGLVSLPITATELPKTTEVKRYGESGALIQRTPRVTVLANDPFLLQHIENVRRQTQSAVPLSASTQESSTPNVEVIDIESTVTSSTVVNNTNAFIFQDITPADTNSQQTGANQVSAAERMQQVEFYRRAIASQKRPAQ
jgi:hypothetical protein